ncbi:hypothetical protein JG687_00012682 [Phytophthora cactorum]|uniref:Uncharacterized protein n=2 Tax=Phytophthora cactorum TaxID=29920 RepID=A0A329SR19_9STRA|nr:hypothetical protein JG687_00012682 [Phytophthora cactorum]RAW39140.1 hypothetical protein PC110_g4630 [Phytophthora cactorum]
MVKKRFEVYVEPKVLVRQPCLDVNLIGVRCSSSLLDSVVLDLEIVCYRKKFEEYIIRNPFGANAETSTTAADMEQDDNTDEGEETLLTELEIHEQKSFAAALALTSLQGMSVPRPRR